LNIEYHYHITYLIAISAGFSVQDANKIAYSSQYVDDNLFEISIYDNSKKNIFYKNQASALKENSLHNTKIIKNTLIPFHFLPGKKASKRIDGKSHELTTTPNNKIAKRVLITALKSKNLYWIGIASHAYVDTWAHQNFVGGFTNFNTMPNSIGNLLPNIGHAQAFDYPDLVGFIWEDLRLKRKKISNITRFLDASINLYTMYEKQKLEQVIGINDFIQLLHTTMLRYKSDNYIMIKLMISSRIRDYNSLAKKISSIDIEQYNSKKWLNKAANFCTEQNRFYIQNSEDFHKSDWYQFQEAVKTHVKFIWKILPI
jgi:hypothetical protein